MMGKICDICKKEIEGESKSKHGYIFHKEKCWKDFIKILNKARKGGIISSMPKL